MNTHTIIVPNDEQYQKLLELAREAGIEVIADGLAVPPLPPIPDLSHLSREELLAIIDEGVAESSIADPLAWQREQRQERQMPFRP